MSDMSDPFGILELFKDPARLTKSVLSDPRSSIGPTCPTSGAEGCAEKVALNQSGPTCPTCPTQIPAEVASPALADVLDEAWQAQARLRAAGLLFIDTGGWACLERQGDLVSGRRRN